MKLLLLLLLPALPHCALTQTSPDKSTVPAGGAATANPNGATRRPPPRVIADLSQFHLDRMPNTKSSPQVGAGSRGSDSNLILCAPTLGLSSSTHPLFQWKGSEGAMGQVTFSLLNGAGDVLFESDVAGSSLLYPDDAPALVPGQTYSWKVSGGGMNKLPEPIGVEIQSKEAHDSLLQKTRSGDAATDPLAQAQVFLREQVWYDAVATLETAIAAHPDRKDLTEQLTRLYQQVVPACAATPR